MPLLAPVAKQDCIFTTQPVFLAALQVIMQMQLSSANCALILVNHAQDHLQHVHRAQIDIYSIKAVW